MNSASRPFAIGVFRFALVTLLASVVLTGTTLLIAHLSAWLYDGAWDSPRFLSIGLVGGMVVWLFVAIFHLRRETQVMAFSNRDQFIAKAKTVLHEMGYALTSTHANTLMFRPHFHSYLLGGGIQVAVEDHEAQLTGPKVSLEVFRRCFRLLNHVQRVQVYLHEHRKFTDNVVKRVEIRLRLRPDQFDSVRSNIIELLQKDGTVVCELNLLVQSDTGIRENTLEFQVREWLQQQGIACEIHKDHVQFVEVLQPDDDLETTATMTS